MNLNEALQYINKSVRNIKPYHLEPEEVPVKLNQNENPGDWPMDIKEEIAAFCKARPWNRYPDFIPEALKAKLAGYAGIDPAGVIVGNGSNEILLVLMLSLIRPGSKVIICQPTFTVYRLLSEGMAAESVPVMLDKEMRFDADAIRAASLANPGSLLIVCTPNNPTGSVLTEEEIVRILDTHKGMVILDQAYVEFGGFNAVPLLQKYPNLLITRTFSKAFAAAGLRVGYLLGTPEIVREVNKIKLPYNINFFTDKVALTLLENRDRMKQGLAQIVIERDSLFAFLSGLPFEAVYKSASNFILVRSVKKPLIFDWLRNAGILVRDVSSYPMLENCLRISVGSPSDNDALKEALLSFFK